MAVQERKGRERSVSPFFPGFILQIHTQQAPKQNNKAKDHSCVALVKKMTSLKISVERLLEQEVDEINRSGEEKYIKPFSLSEELTYLAGKIDFYDGLENLQENTEGGQNGEDEVASVKRKSEEKIENKWPWENVHSKLRIALSETCVMLDVLQNLSKKKYLVLDLIQQNAEPDKQTVQMLEKRKFLARAGSIIAKGAAGLSKKIDESEPIVVEENDNEYYMQLMQLRQYWRVKKTGNQITGDVSYRTAGSTFWHPGLFEVKPDHSELTEKTLTVNISPDLVQSSIITIQLIDQNSRHPWKETSLLTSKRNIDSLNNWEESLNLAQQHIFNKDLFAHLSTDAYQGLFSGVEVLNSKITCKILDDVQVVISHEIGCEDANLSTDDAVDSTEDLKLILTALLQSHHKRNAKWTSPYPATSNYYKKQSRSSTIVNMLNRKKVSQHNSILKEFLDQATHKVWITRLKFYLDEKCKMLNDQSMLIHWNSLKCRLKSSITVSVISKLHLTSAVKASFLISIDQQGMNITFEDSNTIYLHFDIAALNTLIDSKIRTHLQMVAKCLCLRYSWTVVQSTWKYPTFIVENQTGFPEKRLVCVASDKSTSIRVTFHSNITIELSKSGSDVSSLLDSEFQAYVYNPIPLDAIAGSSFIEKFQTLLLCC